ncbi:F-box protein [Raphanus sativus]|nr:F-box protein [Raphanus sativus]
MASQPLDLALSPPNCWSELPLDLMQPIFERLGFADFDRAKSVCSSWLSGSRLSKPNNKIPWMILFPEEKNYCLLLNPEDKEEKLYKTQHLGDDFADNERSKDYLVIREDFAYFKKGDSSWKKISEQVSGSQKGIRYQEDMVFKDHKLYGLTEDELRIFDFSGEFPLQVYRVNVGGCVKLEKTGGIRSPEPWEFNQLRRRNNVVLTLGGDVLIVRSKNEAIILELGVTVLAKDQEGVITSNSIYFSSHDINRYDSDIFVFNLDTKKVEQLPPLVSAVTFSEARWFLPKF